MGKLLRRLRLNLDSNLHLEPEIHAAHRELLLHRTRVISYVALGVLPFTVLSFFYFGMREVFVKTIPIVSIAVLGLVGLIFCLRLKFFRKHYHLPVFILTGIICNFAESTLFPLTGGSSGFFLFPYLLMFFGVATYLPGNLYWITLTLGILPPSFFFAEYIAGHDITSKVMISNLIYLSDVALMAVIANQIMFTMFLREKRTQLELQKVNTKLKELDQAKSNFFANISHELKTPLTLLITPLESLLANVPADMDSFNVPRKTIQSVRQNASRLSILISDLLDLTRSEIGGAKIKANRINKPDEYFMSIL